MSRPTSRRWVARCTQCAWTASTDDLNDAAEAFAVHHRPTCAEAALIVRPEHARSAPVVIARCVTCSWSEAHRTYQAAAAACLEHGQVCAEARTEIDAQVPQ